MKRYGGKLLGVGCLFLLCALGTPVGATTTASTTDVAQGFTRPADLGLRTESIPESTVVGDFVVGPGKVEVRLSPGESRTTELVISNRTGDTRDFLFDIEDAAGTDNGEQAVVLLGDDTGPYTLREYIQLPAERIRLDHNQRVRVPVTIVIPPDAEPIARYGSVLVKTAVASESEVVEPDGSLTQLPIVARVGTLFFVTVPGEEVRDGAVVDFTTIPDHSWFSKGPINFAITYENTGSVHVNPYGELRIHNSFGDEVGYQILDPWFALPNSLRTREVEWNKEALLGRYTATILINRGYDDIVDERTLVFWVVPWQYLLGVFVGLLLFFLLVRGFFRMFEFKRRGS